MIDSHRHAGHLGPKKTFEIIAEVNKWENMYVDIVEFISKCTKCAQDKPATIQMHYWVNLPKFVFHTVSIDIVGPFPTSNVENGFLFVAIEKLTKWVETLASSNTTAKVTAKFLLQHIVFRHGCPQKFLTNNGTNSQLESSLSSIRWWV